MKLCSGKCLDKFTFSKLYFAAKILSYKVLGQLHTTGKKVDRTAVTTGKEVHITDVMT